MLRISLTALLLLAPAALLAQGRACTKPSGQPLIVTEKWLAAHKKQVSRITAAGGAYAPPTGECGGIVVLDTGGMAVAAARAVVDLEKMGWRGRVALLAGGHLPAGLAAERSLVAVGGGQEATQARVYDQRGIVDLDYVRAHLRSPGIVLVDARTRALYTGAELEGPERRGHIPGAINIPYTEVMANDGKMLPAEDLRALFDRAGVHRGELAVVYCHSGNKAALVYLAARWAGIDARLYEGSWLEWSREVELPVETGER